MTRALNRSIPFWILLAASIGLLAVGTVTVIDHLGTMTAALKNGSATGLEVYAGQSWVVIGAALLGTGALGVLLALALAVLSALLRTARAKPAEGRAFLAEAGPVIVVGTTDDLDPEGALDAPAAAHEIVPDPPRTASADAVAVAVDQNGSSGSTATATKSSVR